MALWGKKVQEGPRKCSGGNCCLVLCRSKRPGDSLVRGRHISGRVQLGQEEKRKGSRETNQEPRPPKGTPTNSWSCGRCSWSSCPPLGNRICDVRANIICLVGGQLLKVLRLAGHPHAQHGRAVLACKRDGRGVAAVVEACKGASQLNRKYKGLQVNSGKCCYRQLSLTVDPVRTVAGGQQRHQLVVRLLAGRGCHCVQNAAQQGGGDATVLGSCEGRRGRGKQRGACMSVAHI